MSSDRRTVFLEEMGLGPVWRSREAPRGEAAVIPRQDLPEPSAEPALQAMQEPSPFINPAPAPTPVMLLDEAGLAPSDPAVAVMDWPALKESVANCVKCGLCRNRTQTVFGVGDERAKWLFVGEGPGRNEDLRGEPFVGNADKLLDNMLLALGLRRGDNAYIANIVKCRPTDASGKDRPPTPEEALACLPYLERQIALIDPTVIVALGKTAALWLLGLDPDTPVSKLRGTVHRYAGRPLVVTYHPAYLLRNLPDKSKAWADLCLAATTYAAAG